MIENRALYMCVVCVARDAKRHSDDKNPHAQNVCALRTMRNELVCSFRKRSYGTPYQVIEHFYEI